jgi:hypothetical protein
MHARVSCVGERTWDVSASQAREKRRQGHLFYSALSFPTRLQGRACDRRCEMSDLPMTSTLVIHPAESAPEEVQQRDADSRSHPLR